MPNQHRGLSLKQLPLLVNTYLFPVIRLHQFRASCKGGTRGADWFRVFLEKVRDNYRFLEGTNLKIFSKSKLEFARVI